MRNCLIAAFMATLIATATQTPATAQRADTLAALLSQSAVKYSARSFPTERLRKAYENRGFVPLWLSGGRLNVEGEALVDALSNAYRDGLDSSEYLGGLRGFSQVNGEEDAARLELALSHAFLTFGHDLYSGITTPSVTDPNIVIKRKRVDATQWLEGAARNGVDAMLRTLRPNHPQYAQLRQMLSGYRSLLLRGGWQPISQGGPLKPGMSDPRVAEIRQNLSARGYDSLNTDDLNFFDDGLVGAMKHFQKRHGLAADGVVGPQTFKALSVSAEQRVNQIAINMERWRWLPRNLGTSHLLVNQAGFELFMVKNGKTVDNRRVIVGKPFHQSPMFSDEIIYSEFNPTWTVPASIAGKEMLPKILNNPAYLQDKGYTLYTSWKSGAAPANPFSIDWSTVSAKRFPYRIVQEPGPRNALGQVKFIFPNKFSVYLHDTPSRSLFSRTGRAFSHGCIRVEKPLDFARKIYEHQGGLNPAKVDGIIASKKQTRVNLKRKLPVHLAYFTAWIDENGVPLFFEDVYKRDRLVGRYMF
ncbi:MAG: L,D-transpeptidase family protein [Pseudomonadota bacterium]